MLFTKRLSAWPQLELTVWLLEEMSTDNPWAKFETYTLPSNPETSFFFGFELKILQLIIVKV